jgi:6-pyruvoyltetrahydropterin/6-carboxytetrahydropterin synthase
MEITKKFKFELAHRLVDSYSKKCQSFHGHSYLAEVTLKGDQLDHTGMLMDFGELKDRFSWMIDAWDHSLMLWDQDPTHDRMKEICKEINARFITVDYNPTAEQMAYHMYQVLEDRGFPVEVVRVQETLTGWAYAKGRGNQEMTAHYINIEEASDV